MKTIYSFAGGGVRGLISLQLISQFAFKPDLVCGTSTGAIIAAAMSIGMSYNDIIDAYTKELPNIFKKEFSLSFGLKKPKYNRERLKESLTRIFGNKTTKDCIIPLMVNTVDITNGEEYHFKSWKDNEKLVDILLSSTAALSYFMPNNMYGHQHIDGGFSDNQICYDAYVEAKRLWGEDWGYYVVAIGTGIYNKETKCEIENGGLIEVGKKVIPIFLNQNNQRQKYYMKHNTRERDMFLNLDVQLDKKIELDDISKESMKYMLNTNWKVAK